MATVVGTDEKFVKRCSCRSCAAVIKYTDSETRERRASYMGDTCTETVLDCPRCKAVIVLRSD
mgnify:CR=1 FL=1